MKVSKTTKQLYLPEITNGKKVNIARAAVRRGATKGGPRVELRPPDC